MAVDEDVTRRVASTLDAAYGEKGYEFIFIPDLVGHGEDDEVWAEKFRRFGGEIVLSANKDITRKPNQLIAFQDNDLISFFFQPPWSGRSGHFKLYHSLYWWHFIHKKLGECVKKDCWQVPITMTADEFKRLEVPRHVTDQARRKGAG